MHPDERRLIAFKYTFINNCIEAAGRWEVNMLENLIKGYRPMEGHGKHIAFTMGSLKGKVIGEVIKETRGYSRFLHFDVELGSGIVKLTHRVASYTSSRSHPPQWVTPPTEKQIIQLRLNW